MTPSIRSRRRSWSGVKGAIRAQRNRYAPWPNRYGAGRRVLRGRSIRGCVVAAMLASLAAAVPASASRSQEALLQDDPLLLSAQSQENVDASFATLRSLGVDRVRVSVFWDDVAPDRESQEKPAFPDPGPSSPAAYPRGSWDAYDRVALAAQRHGVALLFTISGPGPAWSTEGVQCGQRPFEGCDEGRHLPSPSELQAFATAVGTRYSGSYRAEGEPGTSGRPPSGIGPIVLDPGEQGTPAQPGPVLPRVDHWSIWNEPNYTGSLEPLWLANAPKTKKQMVAVAPHHYRKLVDATYAGLVASGHGSDQILIGETAPRGGKSPKNLRNAIMPAEFMRELYCVTARFKPYTGAAARARGCPATGAERSRFASDHPGLFRSQGIAHHPYSLAGGRWHPPTWKAPQADNVAIGNLDTLLRTVDRASRRWQRKARAKRLWITEYGYQTSPPDEVAGVSPARQGPLSAWGEYLAYRNPRVATIGQFQLADDKPLDYLPPENDLRWVTWQSGLFTETRAAKPYAAQYALPLHVAGRGRAVRVFGAHRAAPAGAALTAAVQYAPKGGKWRTLRRVRVRSARSYVAPRVKVRRGGQVRIAWSGAGEPVTTREAAVRGPAKKRAAKPRGKRRR